MAPEIALDALAALNDNAHVLDPMCGSGTVIKAATNLGHSATGFDLDPLSVLMTRVWVQGTPSPALVDEARVLANFARRLDPSRILLPWIDNDPETIEFIKFWFGPQQISDLRRLAFLLSATSADKDSSVLRLALSRLIIRKEGGASLGNDISHSRPHRVRTTSTFSVLDEFPRSVEYVIRRLAAQGSGTARVDLADARDLTCVDQDSVDAIVTSPPYLNAIDYMRGHRLSLVWLGYKLSDLRVVRSASVGIERGGDEAPDSLRGILDRVTGPGSLPKHLERVLSRFGQDMELVIEEFSRVLRESGRLVLVVGNSNLRGVTIDNARLISEIAALHALRLESHIEREIPSNRRYMPPPSVTSGVRLAKIMRLESVMSFSRVSR